MHAKHSTLILSPADIEQMVFHFGLDTLMDQLIARMTAAFQEFDDTQTQVPARSGFHYEQPENGLIEWMPVMETGRQVVVKMVGYHPNNPQKFKLPTIVSTVAAYDTATGNLKALMDGVFLTAFRTGAASAVASKLLANPDSKVLGLIGCGAQSITQLHAISRIFDLSQVLYYDITSSAMESFPGRCLDLAQNLSLVASDTRSIVQQADIICTATSIDIGAGPLFSGIATQAHVHINAVGSDFPGKVELPLDLLKNGFVCPDFPAQAIREGECQQLQPEEIAPDIIAVAKDPGRYTWVQSSRSVFDSTGIALEDLVCMELFMECAEQLNLGTRVKIENLDQDAKNPYDFLRKQVPEKVREAI